MGQKDKQKNRQMGKDRNAVY